MDCEECGATANLVDWTPSKGIDPDLKKYLCSNDFCEHVFYAQSGRYFKKPENAQLQLNSARDYTPEQKGS